MARRHGCQQPFNLPQVACCFIFFVLAAGFGSISAPVLPKTWEVATVTLLYALSALSAAALFLYTSIADPSEYGCAVPEEGKPADEEQYYCVLCQIHVKKQSKHCRSCDRCVDGFDHHCKWLNNCVGKKNYWSFFSLVTSTCAMIAVQFAAGVYLFVISFTRSDEVAVRLTDLYGSGLHLTGFRAMHGVFCGLCIPPAILLGELMFFHMILQYKGMTTYDYIMAQSEAKTQALNAAQEEGGKQSKWKLKIFQAGGVSTATNSRKVRVGINPLALLKMDRTKEGGLLACGCGSTPQKGVGSIHPTGDFVPEEVPSPGPSATLKHPFSATLEDQDSMHLKAGRPAAEAEEGADAQPLMQGPPPDLAKLSALSHSTMSKTPSSPSSISANNSKFSLPPIRPPKPVPAFDSL